MSNQLLIKKWGAVPNFATVLDSCEKMKDLPEIRTFFHGYNNPIGIEVECEGITHRPKELRFWEHKEDGSLRNNGLEFVSVPLSGRQIDYALWELGETLKTFPKLSWSHRTSVHVHQNVSTLREEHLTAYTMLYVLYEELFYSMVETYRAANAFCYKTSALDPVDYMRIQDTNKYCGLNLAPIKRQSTIEFRHMHGTSDLRLLRRWIQLIVKLHAWVERMPSKTIVQTMTNHIEGKHFLPLAKEIWGVNSTLFDEKFIQDSAEKNALWSLCIATQEFV